MDIDLTRDAKDMLLTIYDVYRQRIKNGIAKSRAADFTDNEYLSELFPTWPMQDIWSTSAELGRAGYVKYYRQGGILLLGKGIIYCENRLSEAVRKGIDILSKLKP